MPAEVWTARISTRDPDRFNVTRKSGDPVFAPSASLLALGIVSLRAKNPDQASEAWRYYAERYVREMEISHRDHRVRWEEILTKPRVVLTCYCTNPLRCHRTVLAKILAKLGASYRGELPGRTLNCIYAG
jgi:uncharacterized protein YeaO (DUF488 family)